MLFQCRCMEKSVDRPFKFRSATKKLRKARIQRPWPKVDAKPKQYDGKLPFTPVDVESEVADMKARFNLLKQCDIDVTMHQCGQKRGDFRTKQVATISRQRTQRICKKKK